MCGYRPTSSPYSSRTEITRAEALEPAVEGFLPKCALTDRPNDDKRSIFRELGLPYVSDPAVTKHLAAFLAGAPVNLVRP